MPAPAIAAEGFGWFSVTQSLIVVLLSAMVHGIYKGIRAINKTFRRYGERITDLEDWNWQTNKEWKGKLVRRRPYGENGKE